MTSTSVRSTESGVRSSWLALATNRRCASNAACSRSSIASKPAASSATSPRASRTPVRVSSDSTDSRRAVAVTACSGPRTRPTSHHDTSAAATTTSGYAMSPARSTSSRAAAPTAAETCSDGTIRSPTRTMLPGGSEGACATPPTSSHPSHSSSALTSATTAVHTAVSRGRSPTRSPTRPGARTFTAAAYPAAGTR